MFRTLGAAPQFPPRVTTGRAKLLFALFLAESCKSSRGQ